MSCKVAEVEEKNRRMCSWRSSTSGDEIWTILNALLQEKNFATNCVHFSTFPLSCYVKKEKT